jgi:hypothetical protein
MLAMWRHGEELEKFAQKTRRFRIRYTETRRRSSQSAAEYAETAERSKEHRGDNLVLTLAPFTKSVKGGATPLKSRVQEYLIG